MFIYQMMMSAHLELTCVMVSVWTHKALTLAAVNKDMNWILMD